MDLANDRDSHLLEAMHAVWRGAVLDAPAPRASAELRQSIRSLMAALRELMGRTPDPDESLAAWMENDRLARTKHNARLTLDLLDGAEGEHIRRMYPDLVSEFGALRAMLPAALTFFERLDVALHEFVAGMARCDEEDLALAESREDDPCEPAAAWLAELKA